MVITKAFETLQNMLNSRYKFAEYSLDEGKSMTYRSESTNLPFVAFVPPNGHGQKITIRIGTDKYDATSRANIANLALDFENVFREVGLGGERSMNGRSIDYMLTIGGAPINPDIIEFFRQFKKGEEPLDDRLRDLTLLQMPP